MAVSTVISAFPCPNCGQPLPPTGAAEVRCTRCTWRGRGLVFEPLLPQVETARAAMPDDATCAHHPTKKAEAICAGTGDFICSLCAIDLQGQTYSAQYLDRAGKQHLKHSFERYLERPDRAAVTALCLTIFPYCAPVGPAWIVWGFMSLGKAAAMRQQNPLFGQLVSSARLGWLGVLLGVVGLFWLVGVVFLVIGLMH